MPTPWVVKFSMPVRREARPLDLRSDERFTSPMTEAEVLSSLIQVDFLDRRPLLGTNMSFRYANPLLHFRFVRLWRHLSLVADVAHQRGDNILHIL